MSALRAVVLLLPGCLIAAERPPWPCELDPSMCGDFACDPVAGECITRCRGDFDCADGNSCRFGDCEPTCVDEECGGRLRCDPSSNECLDDCERDADCRGQFECCDLDRWLDDECPKLDGCF